MERHNDAFYYLHNGKSILFSMIPTWTIVILYWFQTWTIVILSWFQTWTVFLCTRILTQFSKLCHSRTFHQVMVCLKQSKNSPDTLTPSSSSSLKLVLEMKKKWKLLQQVPTRSQGATVNRKGRGIVNLGNSCFINSTLQCLRHTPQFVQFLEKQLSQLDLNIMYQETMFSKISTAYELHLILKALTQNDTSPIDPSHFLHSLSQCSNLVDNPRKKHYRQTQQDAQEFVSSILNLIHELFLEEIEYLDDSNVQQNELIRQSAMEIVKYSSSSHPESYIDAVRCMSQLDWKEQKESSFVSQLFSGQMTRGCICLNCHVLTCTNQEIRFLPLDILHKKFYCSLVDCLEKFQEPERLYGEDMRHCPGKCEMKTPSETQILLQRLPNCLIIQLKRFHLQPSPFSRSQKITTKVTFPIDDLDLTVIQFNREQNYRKLYSLYAVCAHVGLSMHSGHYVAYCRWYGTKEWYQYNDDQVFPISEKKMIEDTISNAYLLFYVAQSPTKK